MMSGRGAASVREGNQGSQRRSRLVCAFAVIAAKFVDLLWYTQTTMV